MFEDCLLPETLDSLNCLALNLIYNALKLIQTRQQVTRQFGAKNDLKIDILILLRSVLYREQTTKMS